MKKSIVLIVAVCVFAISLPIFGYLVSQAHLNSPPQNDIEYKKIVVRPHVGYVFSNSEEKYIVTWVGTYKLIMDYYPSAMSAPAKIVVYYGNRVSIFGEVWTYVEEGLSGRVMIRWEVINNG